MRVSGVYQGRLLGRLLHRFAHLNERRKVHHRVKAPRLQHIGQHRPVRQDALHKLSAQHRVAVAAAQVVQGGHRAAQLAQALDHVAADVAGTANNKQPHTYKLPQKMAIQQSGEYLINLSLNIWILLKLFYTAKVYLFKQFLFF